MRIPVAFRSYFLAFIVAALGATPGHAEKWVSPDGMVAVEVPDAEVFVRMEEPPDPFLVLWTSRDDRVYLGVRKTEIRPDTARDRPSAEKDIANETGGKIIDSSSVMKNGREVWIITAEAPGHGIPLRITQAIAHVGTDAYQAYEGMVGVEPSDYPAVAAFLNSFEIREGGSAGKSEPATHPEGGASPAPNAKSDSGPTSDAEPDASPPPETEPDTDPQVGGFNLSEWIGSAAVFLVVGLMIWWFAGRGGKTT